MTERREDATQPDSKARAVTSLARIGWTAAKTTAGLVPGGTLAVEGLEILVDHIRGYRDAKVKQRLSHFARALIEGTPSEELTDLLNGEIDQSDFHAVVTALINDEDDEKAGVYAQTLKTLIASEIPQSHRRYIIRTVRALTWMELELARHIYVHSHFRLPTFNASPADPAEQVSQLLVTRDAMRRASIKSLIGYGLLDEPPSSRSADQRGQSSSSTPLPTELLDTIVTAAYPAHSLLPAALGLRERSPVADLLGVFFAYIIEEDQSHVVPRLHEELYKSEIASIMVNPSGMRDRPLPHLKLAVIIAVCISKTGSPLAVVREKVNLATKEVAVILLPGGTDDSTIARSYTLDLRSGRIDDAASFVAWAAKRLHAHLESRDRPR